MKYDKKEFSLTIGKRVREVRKYRGFSLEKLALDTEIEPKQLCRIEYGEINTSIYQIYRLCYSLNVNLSEFFEPISSQSSNNSETQPKIK